MALDRAASALRRIFRVAKRSYHHGKQRMKQRLDLFEPLQIITFRSWGTSHAVRVMGRVLEEQKLDRPREDASLFENVSNTLRRLESDEIPHARLAFTLRGKRSVATADDEGFFQADLDSDLPLDGGWYRVGVELLESIAGGSGLTATAESLVPDANADFIVISDFDDTVVVTNATESLDMARRVLTHNARTRKPFPGVPPFYRALARGISEAPNPIFYVSRSGWNFYDLVTEMLDHHDIPPGPMMMRDLALIESRAESFSTDEQKLSKIEEVLEAFPDHRFVMIGDSGQGDAEIYRDCAAQYGSRVAAVYLRKVHGHDVDADTAEAIRSHGTALCISDSTLEWAEHAAEHGLITPQEVARVAEAEKEKESGK